MGWMSSGYANAEKRDFASKWSFQVEVKVEIDTERFSLAFIQNANICVTISRLTNVQRIRTIWMLDVGLHQQPVAAHFGVTPGTIGNMH